MKCRIVFSLLAAVVVSLTTAVVGAADGRALIIAPGNYQHLPDLPNQQWAGDAIRSRLLKAGWEPEKIQLLTGTNATVREIQSALDEATANVMSDELFLVYVCAYGVQYDDVDYICAADTPSDAKGEAGKRRSKLISLSRIIKRMSISAAERKMLVVDGVGLQGDAYAAANSRFGRRPPVAQNDGQWTIVNRSPLRRQRGETELTGFTWSFLDGITVHADGNQDGVISVLELSAYMKLAAEHQERLPPRFTGKLTNDAQLLASSEQNDTDFPREELDQLAEKATEYASRLLVFEFDADYAVSVLDRARRLARDDKLRAEIQKWEAAVRIMKGQARQVLPWDHSSTREHYAVVAQDAYLGQQLVKAGTQLTIGYQSSDGYGRVLAAETPRIAADGSRVLEPLPGNFRDQLHWIHLSFLTPAPGEGIPNPSFQRNLDEAAPRHVAQQASNYNPQQGD